MSEQETRIERTGNIWVHQTSPHQPVAYPVKQAEVIEFKSRWKLSLERNLWEKQEAA